MTDPAESGQRGLPGGWLFLLACLPWLPWPALQACYWQSDDFLALHHVQDFGRVLGDFVGPQYDMPALVLFYRPLITLSFWLDSLWGAAAPLVSHLENCLAHGGSTLLLAALLRRLLGRPRATCAALVWAWMPSHAGSILWAVGRVDSFTVVWILASTLAFLQVCEGQRQRRHLDLGCFVLALCCKELAAVVLGLQALCAWGTGHRSLASLRRLLLPGLLVLLGYLLWRRLCLGIWVGGYEGRIDAAASLQGLAEFSLQILNPLWQLSWAPHWSLSLGLAAPLFGLYCLRRRLRLASSGLLLLVFLGCALPVLQLWAQTDNPKNLRNFYLPAAALAVLLGGGGLRPCLLALGLALPGLVEMRFNFWISSRNVHAAHQQLLAVKGPSQAPLLVAGLARESFHHRALEFDQGVDRLLRAPFAQPETQVYALRPLSHMPGRYALPLAPDAPQPALLAFDGIRVLELAATDSLGAPGPAQLRSGPSGAALKVLQQGSVKLDRAVLDRMVQDYKAGAAPGPDSPGYRLPGRRSPWFRVTVFTAGGYLSCFVPDRAPADSTDGFILSTDLLMARTGQTGAAADQALAVPLRVACALDLTPRFPLLIEAGQGGPGDFRPEAANRQPAHLQLIRAFADWYTL